MGYVDTSALVAYYCPEPLSPVVERILRKLAAPTISPLVEVELHAAVAVKLRRGELDAGSANRIVSEFRLHLEDGLYHVVPIQAREFSLARDWIARFSTALRTLDALHLAAAFANGLTLVTADKGLAKAALALGVRSRLVR